MYLLLNPLSNIDLFFSYTLSESIPKTKFQAKQFGIHSKFSNTQLENFKTKTLSFWNTLIF